MTRFSRAGAAGIGNILTSLIFFSVVWFILTGEDQHSWFLGVPAILLAVLVSRALGGGKSRSVDLLGFMRFAPYFLGQSLMSGIDVLRRTFAPKPRINPGIIHYTTFLPQGKGRILLANTISLMPGTLSADLQEDLIIVHTLDVDLPVEDGIQQLEARIALFFSLSPSERTS